MAGRPEPAFLTGFLLRPAMHRTQRSFLASRCSTYCQVRLRAPRVVNAAGHGTSLPSRRKLMRNAGYPSSLQSEKRTQRPKLVAIAESPLRSDSTGPGPVLEPPRSARRLRRPCRCRYGPLLRPAIHRNLAVASDRHLTTSRSPRDEALHNSATPTQRSEVESKLGVGGNVQTFNVQTFDVSRP
jgi:hypothetical protein